MEDEILSKLEDDAPSTIKEVGIHIAYMRRDISNLTQMVQELPNGFATKEELLGAINRIKALEDEHGSFWVRFGIPTASAVLGGIFVILILSYLGRFK
jgi:hypothetical protein